MGVTDIDAMVSRKQWDRVQRCIALGTGWFVRPTVFVGVTNDMQVAREEIFGPVLCVIGTRDDEDAIAIAADTVYGLQAGVHSADLARARAVASRLLAGRVQVNGLQHEPMAPFGGVRQSGLGREFGLAAFLEPRTVVGPDQVSWRSTTSDSGRATHGSTKPSAFSSRVRPGQSIS